MKIIANDLLQFTKPKGSNDPFGFPDRFSANYSAKNHYRPWLTYSAGFSKLFLLNNYNLLSAGVLLNVSTTSFFEANYSFQVPNQPVTSGNYRINGTSLGLSIQYIFTGINKTIMRQYEKKNKI